MADAVKAFMAPVVALAVVGSLSVALAQERPRVRLNVSDAIDFALAHHPSLRSRSAIEVGDLTPFLVQLSQHKPPG